MNNNIEEVIKEFLEGEEDNFEQVEVELNKPQQERARIRRKKEKNYKRRVKARIKSRSISSYEREDGAIIDYSKKSPWEKVNHDKLSKKSRLRKIREKQALNEE